MFVHPKIEWQVVTDVAKAISRHGFSFALVYRSPLGVRDPRPSWVVSEIDALAASGFDRIPNMLKYVRPEGYADNVVALQQRFRALWLRCPLPPSPATMSKGEASPAWSAWVMNDVPSAIAACNCDVDLPAAEGFMWALFDAPRYRMTTRSFTLVPPGNGNESATHRLAFPAGATWNEVASKLPSISIEETVELIAQ